MQLFRSGRLVAAHEAVGALLRREPSRAEAHHLRGLIAAREQRGAEALSSLDTAIALRPDVPELHVDRAWLLKTLSQPAAALASADAAIRLRPHWPAAHNLRGALLLDLARPGAAAESLAAAIAIDPECFDAYNNLGVVLGNLQRPAEAIECFGSAIRLRPEAPEPYVNRAAAWRAVGKTAEALRDSESALAFAPTSFEARLERGLALRELGRTTEALAAVDAALAGRPDHAGALDARGALLFDLRRPHEAMESFERALALEPANPSALKNAAVTLRELRRYPEGLAFADRAITISPTDAVAHSVRSALLVDMRRTDEALSSAEEALRLDPALLAARLNRAAALADLERVDEALAVSAVTLREHPTAAQAWVSQGALLAAAARTDEALETLEHALILDPKSAMAAFHAATTHLQAGHLERGFELYELRLRPGGPVSFRAPKGTQWRGEPLAGRGLLLKAEQGFGDALHFCRYALLAVSRGAAVTLVVHDGLEGLIGSLSSDIEVIGLRAPTPPFDYYAPLLSLPHAFGTTLRTIPAPVPYLHASPERVDRWRATLGTHGFRIGIAWQGSTGKMDIGRSFPLAALAPLAALPNVRLVSLQKGTGEEQLARSTMRVESFGEAIDPRGEAFQDTAAIIESCDLVVSSDTAVAHLAGALGRPAWIALKFCPEWRWLLHRSDSPWYPTLRLFRQPRPGDWTSVFAAMARELESLLPSSNAGAPWPK